MKTRFLTSTFVILVLAIFGAGNPNAYAITLGIDPPSQDVNFGDQAMVDLTISGLGDFAPDSLSVFDLDISFDASIVSFNSAVFGDQLDLFGLGSITGVTPGAGTVNLFELSFDLPDDLDALQAGSFTLATLTFDTAGLGLSALDISINALGDSLGNPLDADIVNGAITVVDPSATTVIPEPSTYALMIFGLIGLCMARKRMEK